MTQRFAQGQTKAEKTFIKWWVAYLQLYGCNNKIREYKKWKFKFTLSFKTLMQLIAWELLNVIMMK